MFRWRGAVLRPGGVCHWNGCRRQGSPVVRGQAAVGQDGDRWL